MFRKIARKLLPLAVKTALRDGVRKAGAVVSRPLKTYWCTSQGMRLGRGWRLCGKPLFRRIDGGVISIGDRFTAISRSDENAIGVFQPVTISAIGRESIVSIGNDVGMSGCSITAVKSVAIGDRVMIGSGVLILDTDSHAADPVERFQGKPGKSEAIVIENDVFIGARAIILKGSHIGRCAIIGAGAVITGTVPALGIAAGNPARIIGRVSPVAASAADLLPE